MPQENETWVPVEEYLPNKGRRVLVCGRFKTGVRWRTVAEYWPAGTMSAENWDDPPEDWWDADGNHCVCPDAGWWETPIEGETSWLLSNVTHWMFLPAFPAMLPKMDEQTLAKIPASVTY